MRPIVVVEVFPSLQLRIEIGVIGISQQLIKLGLIRWVRPFDFAIQLWRLGFDIHMSHPLIFNMPVKASLKLMTSVGSDGADPEGELLDHMVHEPDRTLLIMFWIDL
jgi:hypothetical protein